MKRVLFLLMITLVAGTAFAQPKARRQQQAQQQKQQVQNQGMSMRARLMFPTAIDMPEDVVWRRDIYREIDLNQDANGGLYYPVEPIDKQLNLFTYVFKLALNGYIPVYEYRLDGNELFTDSARVQMKTVLDNYHIYYEEKDGKLRVDNSDIPSAEVKLYYLKESAYYDQANSSFHRKVQAICPVMLREDDFGGEASKYPLFWVKYSDLEPFLSRQNVMTSNLNNAATMSMDDYFTLNRYEGKIYKTNNMLGKTLAQYCPTDSALTKEQQKIEGELKAFEQNIFGDKHRKDSLDSIANVDPKDLKATKKASKKGKSAEATAKTKRSRRSSASSSGSARVSVRRERH
ncbi:MAG: gliding motility protein GldN [Prevotella sp.]|nr:gliding motility protein GldN [Prevotella sp.]MBR1505000.1 gliding motility protein GldN [Prevotella sp.]